MMLSLLSFAFDPLQFSLWFSYYFVFFFTLTADVKLCVFFTFQVGHFSVIAFVVVSESLIFTVLL